MTTKKKSKKQLIVQAFMQCVIEQGLSSSPMSEIALKIGIDRSSLYYYFKSREQLIDALVEHVVEEYVEQFNEALSAFSNHTERAHQLVEHLFGNNFHQPTLSQVIDELATLGNREKYIAVQVKAIYQAVESAIVKEIDLAYPDADVEDRRWVAYAITQLSEGCSVFTAYGFSDKRLEAGKKAALRILEALES